MTSIKPYLLLAHFVFYGQSGSISTHIMKSTVKLNRQPSSKSRDIRTMLPIRRTPSLRDQHLNQKTRKTWHLPSLSDYPGLYPLPTLAKPAGHFRIQVRISLLPPTSQTCSAAKIIKALRYTSRSSQAKTREHVLADHRSYRQTFPV